MMEQKTNEKLRIYQLLSSHLDWIDTLREAIEVEKKKAEEYEKLGYGTYYGWEWFESHTPVSTLHKMVTEKVLDITLSTRSGTHFRVRQPEVVTEVIKALEEPTIQLPPKVIPDNLFDIIVGHDNIKTIVRYAIEAEKPVHLLFSGPPASSKTLFLMELSRLPESWYCVDSETECLSIGGWKKYNELSLGELILTKDPKEGTLEWEPIQELNIYPNYSDEAVEFKSRVFSAVTTLNHRWLVCGGRNGDQPKIMNSWQLSISKHLNRIHRVGKYIGPNMSPYTDDEVELIGWVLTEGTFKKGGSYISYVPKKRITYAVSIGQSEIANMENVQRIDSLFSRLGIKFSRRVYSGSARWTFSGDLARKVRAAVPGKQLSTLFLVELTFSQLKLLYGTMMRGDGSTKGGEKFHQKRKEDADSFQVLVTLIGKASSLSSRDQTSRVHVIKGKKVVKGIVSWRVGVHKREFAHSRSSYEGRKTRRGNEGKEFMRKIYYEGVMWCPTVSNGTFVARREGHVYITGNCLAQTTSQAGLANALFVYQPRFLLIDEIDRLSGDHIGVLNSLMATGIISETKYGKTRSAELSTKVFAAGIRIHLLPRDLLSRFTQLKFNPYTEEEFIKVSTKVLSSLENLTESLAETISKNIWAKNQTNADVRSCVQIARLCGGNSERAGEVLRILRKQ